MRKDPLFGKCRFIGMPDRDRFEMYVYRCPMSGCWLWGGAVAKGGYGMFVVRGVAVSSHRQAWMFKHGEIPAGAMVCHACDNPYCVNPDHLFIGDAQSNSDDKVAKNRHLFGERYPKAKLTAADVVDIRRLASIGADSVAAIGRRYGIGPSQTKRIVKGEKWRHV
jgi:hypothetical protein